MWQPLDRARHARSLKAACEHHDFLAAFRHRGTLRRQTACFIVKDNGGHALAYVYFEDEPGRRAAANLLRRDEAGRLAANIAKLPALLGRGSP